MAQITSSALRTIPAPANGTRSACVIATGSYLPEQVMTNHDLARLVETNDEWVRSRTGIAERRIAGEKETPSEMGAKAAQAALAQANLSADDIDLIICATSSPDMAYPATACFLQAELGVLTAPAFDLSAACSGFVYAMDVARQFIASGGADTVLVVGTEKNSAVLNWKDRNTCVLFGDGASAVIMQHQPGRRGMLYSEMGADGTQGSILYLANGGMRSPLTQNPLGGESSTIQMNGREVYKNAVTIMQDCTVRAVEGAGLKPEDITCFIPHQANVRIIESIAARMNVPLERFYLNLDRYGNTSAAAVGIALDEAHRDGVIKRGDYIVMVAFGGGLTWASNCLEW